MVWSCQKEEMFEKSEGKVLSSLSAHKNFTSNYSKVYRSKIISDLKHGFAGNGNWKAIINHCLPVGIIPTFSLGYFT